MPPMCRLPYGEKCVWAAKNAILVMNSTTSGKAIFASAKLEGIFPADARFIIRVNQILHADQKIVHSSNDIDLTSIDGPPVSPKPSHTNASDKCVECGRELCQPLILRSLPPTEIIKIASCRRDATIKAWTEANWIHPELCQQGRDS